jgi:hypothetical protein
MFTSKFLDFQDWATILNLKLSNQVNYIKSLNPTQLELCLNLKDKKNAKRTIWEHLNKIKL